MTDWYGRWEGNPVLGKKPDSSTVDGYFSFVLGGEAVGGAFASKLPGNWKWAGVALMLTIAALEVRQAEFNHSRIGWCI